MFSREWLHRKIHGGIKIEFFILLAVMMVFFAVISIIMGSRQRDTQKRINELDTEMANMAISAMIAEKETQARVVNLDALGIGDDFYEAADDIDSENVVWSYMTEGELVEHKVYLTFDDGPSTNTEEILEILSQYDIKATFFVIGRTDEHALEMYKRIVEEGHTLAMHSYSHKYSEVYRSTSGFEEDLTKIRDLLEETTGVRPAFYRFPGGSSNTVSKGNILKYIDILDQYGITYFDWNISSGDATSNSITAEEIIENSLDGIEKRHTSVILLHDTNTKGTTVEALPAIIEGILSIPNTEILPITEDTELVQHVTK